MITVIKKEITVMGKMIAVIYQRNHYTQNKGHSPSLCCFRAQLRRIVLRIPRRKRLGEAGQTITEFAILFVMVAVVLIFSINGPMRDSLSSVFTNILTDISDSFNNLI